MLARAESGGSSTVCMLSMSLCAEKVLIPDAMFYGSSGTRGEATTSDSRQNSFSKSDVRQRPPSSLSLFSRGILEGDHVSGVNQE